MTATILIAEQEPETRAFLKTILERAGFRTILSCDAESAMAQASCRAPCLLIIDALLPGDGAARLIRHCESLPVIVTSAVPMKSLFLRHGLLKALFRPGKASQALPFLEKPLQEDELFPLIHSLTRKGAHVQPSDKG
jgi:DNA-binding NtrC family response regulator